MIKIKRIYDRAEFTDGTRVLVDRLWPRGVRRSTAYVDIWMKNVGPSNELRKWFAHEDRKWVRFKARYVKELKTNPAYPHLIKLALHTDPVTLLFASSNGKHNNAVVLFQLLNRELKKGKNTIS
jgi:uncharacterized protein YeaO (DUF488 family)